MTTILGGLNRPKRNPSIKKAARAIYEKGMNPPWKITVKKKKGFFN